MSHTSRTKPPTPKERPAALATSGPPLAPPALPAPPPAAGRKGDMIGFWVFAALILLGLIASARAFLVM